MQDVVSPEVSKLYDSVINKKQGDQTQFSPYGGLLKKCVLKVCTDLIRNTKMSYILKKVTLLTTNAQTQKSVGPF